MKTDDADICCEEQLVPIETIATDVLTISYASGGPAKGAPVLLLHGWPDDPRGWNRLVPQLEAGGFRWFAPWLRGFGGTSFRSTKTVRDGTSAAIAQDAFDLADALGLDRFRVVGHDWGGRAAYVMGALNPDRIISMACLAIGYAPRGAFIVPAFPQARRWWYQWFMTIEGGADALRRDPIGFARLQWETWSPAGWFDDAEFDATAESFRNPDWADITLNGYRSRWQAESLDQRYDRLRARIAAVEKLTIPTLLVVGSDDGCDPPEESANDAQYFTRDYRRVVIDGAGHFPAREKPHAVSAALLEHFGI